MNWILHKPETNDNFECWTSECRRFKLVHQNWSDSPARWVVWQDARQAGHWPTKEAATIGACALLPPLEQLAREA